MALDSKAQDEINSARRFAYYTRYRDSGHSYADLKLRVWRGCVCLTALRNYWRERGDYGRRT